MWLVFMAVLYSLNRFVFKPTFKLLDQREGNTEGLKQKALKAADETKKGIWTYEQALAETRLYGATEREETLKQARIREREIIDAARVVCEKKIAELRGEINKEKEGATLQLHSLVRGLADHIFNKVLEKKILISFFMALSFLFYSPSLYAGEGHEGGKHSTAPALADLYNGINFFILLLLLFFLLKKPVKEFFGHRSAAIRMEVDEAKKLYDAAIKENEAITKRLKGLEEEMKKLQASIKEESEAERAKILEQADLYAENLKGDAHKLAEGELKKAKEELKEMAASLSRELVEKRLREELSTTDQQNLVKSSIEKIKRAPL